MKTAWRHLVRSRRRTRLTLLAVMIPVLFLVLMFGLSNSMLADLFDSATRIDTGHLQVRQVARRGTGSAIPLMTDPEAVVATIDALDGVEWRTVRLDLPALASSGNRSQTVYVQGIVPEEIAPVSTLRDLVVRGRYLQTGDAGAIIGEELADLLAIGIGDDIVLLGAHPDAGVGVLKVPVVGVFSAPLAEMGRTVVQVTLETARRLARSPNAATAVIARVHGVVGPRSLHALQAVAGPLAEMLPDYLEVLDWRSLAPQVHGYQRILEPTLLLIATVFFGLGALVVLNTLYLSVLERTRELGVTLSLGASRGHVIRGVLTEAGLIAVAGAVGGATLGVALILMVEALGGIPIPGTFAGFMKAVGMSPVIHMAVHPSQVVVSVMAMIAVALSAAWFPAYRASRLEPVEAMRYVE